MQANEHQVGGTHYGGGAWQHWDFVLAVKMGYLEGVASKYLCRWREKGGLQDLSKVTHYIDKLIEAHRNDKVFPHPVRPLTLEIVGNVELLRNVYKLSDEETAIVRLLANWIDVNDLQQARGIAQRIEENERLRLSRPAPMPGEHIPPMRPRHAPQPDYDDPQGPYDD